MLRTALHTMTLLSLLLCLSLVARANTIHVPADQPTLAAALGASAEDDTILLADGIYSEQDYWVENKGVTIQSESGNPNACILDTTRILFDKFDDRAHALTIRGITIQNDWDYPIFVEVDDNSGLGYTVTLSNCVFAYNQYPILPGSFCVLTVTHCTFQYTAGIFSDGPSSLISDCAFTNNASGGVVTNNSGNMVVANSTFSGNQGFTVRNFGSNLAITNSTFYGNRGSAVVNNGVNLAVINSIFVHNTTSAFGGAVSGGGTISLSNCTFSSNQADVGAGAVNHYNDGASPDNSLNITNCILWGNTARSAPQILNTAPSVLIANSLIQDYPGLTSVPDANGNFSADPLFVRNPSPGPDGQWGTDDDDFGDLHLLFESPAINTGNNILLPADLTDLDNDGDTAELLPLDLDGNPRISRGSVDLGAYEYQNLAPNANSQNRTTLQGVPLALTLTGSDPEGDALTFTVQNGPTHGTLSGTAPNLTYTPNPGYFGNDSFTFLVTDAYGAISNLATVSITVQPDAIAPASTASASPLPHIRIWNQTNVTVSLTASDNPGGSGVKEIHYNLGNGEVIVAGSSASFQITQDGKYLLTYYAVDNAGNREAPKTLSVNLDKTPAVTTAGMVGNKITLSATDNLSGVFNTYYQLDGGTKTLYTGPIPVSSGHHTLLYWSTDLADNVESAHTLSF